MAKRCAPSPVRLDGLQEPGRDDLVGVDVGLGQGRGHAGQGGESAASVRLLLHAARVGQHGRSMAEAAAMAGADQVGAAALPLASLEVAVGGGGAALARRQPVRDSCRGTWSSPPLAIQTRPSIRMRSRPSASACSFTRPEPGTTKRAHPGRPRRLTLGDAARPPGCPRYGC